MNNFVELLDNETEIINGGVNMGAIAGGACVVAGCIGIGVAVAAVPILALPLLGEIGVCALSGAGGYAIGWGIMN